MIPVSRHGRIGKENASDEDRHGCFLLLVGVVVVCVSSFLAYREPVYLCLGRPLWVFGASLIAIIVYIGWLIREANTPIRGKRRS